MDVSNGFNGGSVESSSCTSAVLHVEAVLRADCTADRGRVRRHVRDWLHHVQTVNTGQPLTSADLSDKLSASVSELTVYETRSGAERRCVVVSDAKVHVHLYRLEEGGPEVEEVDDEAGLPAANQWLLPSRDFHGLWQTLVYDSDVKQQLLNFVETTLVFSDRGVDSNLISWNRVVLLHGPPGTGKTSLCKALAQKVAIRLGERYHYSHLVEINSHSLFSKWFSESGKLVQKMFAKIQDLLEDPKALVCVLIDEVESLTAARKNASGAEPSDAIRVVNALLTQIDQIQRFPNVLILTTSNITGAIDLAFVDRADIKQLIALPSPAAIYRIYHSCVDELARTRIVSSTEKLFTLYSLELTQYADNAATGSSLKLWRLAQQSVGLSGRTLRKLPFLSLAYLLNSAAASGVTRGGGGGAHGDGTAPVGSVSLADFLQALETTIRKQFQDRSDMDSGDRRNDGNAKCEHCGNGK